MSRTVAALTFVFVIMGATLPFAANLASGADVAENTWTTKAPMNQARNNLGMAVVNGKIYAIGGLNESQSFLGTNEMYDPETDKWVSKTPMPTPRSQFAISVYQNKIYVTGGLLKEPFVDRVRVSDANEVYDPSTDTWETKASMPTPRSGLSASVVKGKIYLLGGGQEFPYPNWGPSSINEVYDPETDTWATKTSMPQRVFLAASVVVNEKIHVLGGQFEFLGGGYGDFHQVYDPENDTWTTATPVPEGFFSAGAGATTGTYAPKRIYVIGGERLNEDQNPSNVTQIYNPDQDSWTVGAPMPTPRSGISVAVLNDELYAIGGWPGFWPMSAANEKYTPIGYSPVPPDDSEQKEGPAVVPVAAAVAVVAVVVVAAGLLIVRRRGKEA
jgi:N-acetylneuraminic acid mutarotase